MSVFILIAGLRPASAQINCGHKPPAPPKRISGGEGFPPLPLPVTPLRRTERKRPPAPPTLVAKVNYVTSHVKIDGQEKWLWTTPTNDTKSLFNTVRRTLGVNYKADVVRLNQFGYAPEATPIMYFTGRESFELTESHRAALRDYVLDGGAILGAAGNGTDAFAESFIAEIRKIFPDRPWHKFPPEHPIYHSHYKINEVQYRRGANDLFKQPPQLEGINIGCRAAVIFSRADLSCGWDHHTHDDGFRAMPQDASKLGVNLVAYLLASYRLGRVMSTPVVFREVGKSTGEVKVGQIVHGGDWDPSPSGIQHLLKRVSEETSAYVDFRRTPVDLESGNLFDYPFLLLTGHLDFHFSDKARDNLRAYLDRGGFLLVSNCCNRRAFDRAVRRELKGVFPNDPLEPLGATHPVYSAHFDLVARASQQGRLEGVTRRGITSVVYSPGSIASAWDGEPRPYVDLPDPDLALQAGVNILVYSMTH